MKFTIFETQDGSPSINFLQSETLEESMHNKKGAYSETLYIYHKALQLMTEQKWPQKICSVGLGIGYNEFISIAHWLKEPPYGDFYLESFESEKELVDNLLYWLYYPEQLDPVWTQTYDKILALVAQTFSLPDFLLKSEIKKLHEQNKWIIREALDSSTQFGETFSCILFDAYSSKTSPGLWTEEFLKSFLRESTHPECVLTTYAAKGTLNRALKVNSFQIYQREGYGGKRQSTLGVRGVIIDSLDN